MTLFMVLYHWKNFHVFNMTIPVNTTLGNTLFDIMDVFGSVVLSYFFFVSGFLLYQGLHDGNILRRKIKTRLYSLGLPFLVWNALVLLWNFAYTLLTTRSIPDYAPLDYLWGFTFKAFCGPLWYLLALILLLPLAALIIKIKKHLIPTVALLVVLSVAAFVLSRYWGDDQRLIEIWFSRFLNYVPIYCLGIYFALYRPRKVMFASVPKAVYVGAGIVLVSACTVLAFDAWSIYICQRLCYLLIPTAMWILLSPSWLHKLRIRYPLKISFFIYAMHGTLISLLNTLLYRMVGYHSFSTPVSITVHLLLLVVLYAVCLVFAFVCKKILPKKCYAVLSGGRA